MRVLNSNRSHVIVLLILFKSFLSWSFNPTASNDKMNDKIFKDDIRQIITGHNKNTSYFSYFKDSNQILASVLVEESQVFVSMRTTLERLPKAELTVQSIFRGIVVPNHVYIYLNAPSIELELLPYGLRYHVQKVHNSSTVG